MVVGAGETSHDLFVSILYILAIMTPLYCATYRYSVNGRCEVRRTYDVVRFTQERNGMLAHSPTVFIGEQATDKRNIKNPIKTRVLHYTDALFPQLFTPAFLNRIIAILRISKATLLSPQAKAFPQRLRFVSGQPEDSPGILPPGTHLERMHFEGRWRCP
jgi:hypothetical protein